MQVDEAELVEIHADFCKVLSSSKRLMIIRLLAKKEMSVGEISQALKAQHSNISQHLRILRSRHVVESHKEGQAVYYRLANPRLAKICAEIRSILLAGMEQRGRKAKGLIRKKS
jgi:DNA-binding transcriptional ArsR family regulator